jgi:hypothetical protein
VAIYVKHRLTGIGQTVLTQPDLAQPQKQNTIVHVNRVKPHTPLHSPLCFHARLLSTFWTNAPQAFAFPFPAPPPGPPQADEPVMLIGDGLQAAVGTLEWVGLDPTASVNTTPY